MSEIKRWRPAEGRAPILEYINGKLPPMADSNHALARKHNCGSVWCPECYRRHHLARHYERFRAIPQKEARFLTLTLDREKVGIGADAWLFIRQKKALGRFFVSLARQGVSVKDWCGVMEFHKDGTPHFHILTRTKTGAAGRIGNEKLLKAWPWGAVREEYFRSKGHYRNTIGDFGKYGYFHKKKAYQAELPDYLRSDFFKGKKIQRFFTARGSSGGSRESGATTKQRGPNESITKKNIDECGRSTVVYSLAKRQDGWTERYLGRLGVPYSHFKVIFNGSYEPGRGLFFRLEEGSEDDEEDFNKPESPEGVGAVAKDQGVAG